MRILFIAVLVLFSTTDADARKYRRDTAVQIVGGRCAECVKWPKTARLYCACCSAAYLGMDNSRGQWNSSRSWLRLPGASPGPGMAVVRPGHVAVIIGGGPGAWQLYDPNSGGGLTRIHVRPLFGRVVNPKASVARLQ